MRAGDCDFDGAFHVRLAFDVCKVDLEVMVCEELRQVSAGRLQRSAKRPPGGYGISFA